MDNRKIEIVIFVNENVVEVAWAICMTAIGVTFLLAITIIVTNM